MDDKWVQTRMEMNLAREWYLVGTPYCGNLEYVQARIPEEIAPQGARVLLMDGTAVESAFALLLTKVTKPPYPAKISYNRHNWRKYRFCVISGTNLRMGGERKWQ